MFLARAQAKPFTNAHVYLKDCEIVFSSHDKLEKSGRVDARK